MEETNQVSTMSPKPNPFRTVTPLSKALALILFIALPFIGYYLGWSLKNNITSIYSKCINNSTLIKNKQAASGTPNSQVISPVYTSDDYVVFAHYALGYEVEYPATILDTSLVGATGGNFSEKSSDGSTALIYDIYFSDSAPPLTIDNIMQLTICGEGGCSKFFEDRAYEKFLEKKTVELDGKTAFWVKTTITEGTTYPQSNSPVEAGTIERYIIPQHKGALLLELSYKDKLSSEFNKLVSSFRFIPDIPGSWKVYDNATLGLSFKYPAGYKITEDNKKKQIDINSSQGTIVVNYFDKDTVVGKYFNYDGYSYYLNLDSAYSAERYLGRDDISNLKFSINAFTYSQGGNVAVRVFDPDQQQIAVYFNIYVYGNSLLYRISAPKNMEMVMNQILMSVNELALK